MVVHIKTFFEALLGVTLPEIVYIIFALSVAFFILRAFLSIMNVNVKIFDRVFLIVIGFLAVSALGGLTWNFSLS